MHENRQFPARWTVDTMTELFDDTAAAKGSSASLTAKISAMDTAIAGKQDALTFDDTPTTGSSNPVKSSGIYTALSGKASAADQAADRAALVELVDGGAKNLSQWNAGTGINTIGSRVPISTNGGNFVISFQSTASTGYITLGLKDANDGTVAAVQINNSGTKIQEVEIPPNVVYFNVVSSVNASYSNFMICSKAAWDISHAFQPYRPTYQELYEMVLAQS